MKRILTIAVLIFSFMFVIAQTPNNHLTFKGIPITGTVESFAQKLGAKGFKKTYSGKSSIRFEGEFAGYSKSLICVFKVPNRNIVHKVVVCFPEKSSWANLEKEYYKFKEMLTYKYGDPTVHSEEFEEGASTVNDDAKMLSLKVGNCDYFTQWEVKNGIIQVDIAPIIDTDDGWIRLAYFDKINCALVDKAKEDDL